MALLALIPAGDYIRACRDHGVIWHARVMRSSISLITFAIVKLYNNHIFLFRMSDYRRQHIVTANMGLD